ncbi:MAG: hypothetical protein JGK17_01560 [Microcoleus sp. PH2017_10_PVI_O_A]|uniref:hypothetical protein n=1 Tax=unclassified Microcoleus TaxID=2642155 RepID=UPI001D2FDABE|nr:MULTISPECIES: hypothetical protein [unclassified Microcoleus]TAE84964.1 MAG: hypothetical protein EAZ83_04195 [Oscillatoriales cyanobacterium]MCC3404303.1 hypothetical protein [Microcoleus sp. PH2017_10_PVI_O_A]MCC3458392.1 hypothetical protein [Microcoleus sp. PH2017_11_PCY_U_A]MCC3476730.1 hypothetical protein [Microcoleus sp. PH2017_12_PCY_D_A]MCC3526869.1 hypothetical protein [Microcoleus sp. PH2017_21_RUC_O_A]
MIFVEKTRSPRAAGGLRGLAREVSKRAQSLCTSPITQRADFGIVGNSLPSLTAAGLRARISAIV